MAATHTTDPAFSEAVQAIAAATTDTEFARVFNILVPEAMRRIGAHIEAGNSPVEAMFMTGNEMVEFFTARGNPISAAHTIVMMDVIVDMVARASK